MLAAAVRRTSSRAGSQARARESSSSSERRRASRSTPSCNRVSARTAASPSRRTDFSVPATLTAMASRENSWLRTASSHTRSSGLESSSLRMNAVLGRHRQSPQESLNFLRLETPGRPIYHHARRRNEQFLNFHESIGREGSSGVDEIDDRVREPGQGSKLDRSSQRDDLRR